MLIKVMDDYGCWPLWVRDSPGGTFENRDPADLGLTSSLVGRLAAWQRRYESMVDIADPNDSHEVSRAEDDAHAAEGRLLAARVVAELPYATVWYCQDLEPDSRQ
ncbi:hypothetical protein O7635_32620 [Asanoa sp. WMMD1127]|uniref:hypothetical protein n=1 Tax=Asanoa sp. WMMD1127 TaxID=3016107 RepID=UPI002415ED29|nr:hypothetical protein [Asanoa sp. WMMD1127]MDG4826619.1 hypothetical protein [Asanoa sp. WMMD1127]